MIMFMLLFSLLLLLKALLMSVLLLVLMLSMQAGCGNQSYRLSCFVGAFCPGQPLGFMDPPISYILLGPVSGSIRRMDHKRTSIQTGIW
jgi:hypothetical protein